MEENFYIVNIYFLDIDTFLILISDLDGLFQYKNYDWLVS